MSRSTGCRRRGWPMIRARSRRPLWPVVQGEHAMAQGPYNVVLLPGDGVGVEVIAQARRVLDALSQWTGTRFEFDEVPGGAKYFLEHGRDWPEGSEQRCERADVILLGAIG